MSDTLRQVQALVTRGEVRVGSRKPLVSGLYEAKRTMIRRTTKLVHEGKYVAEVVVDLIEEEGGWSPYLSLDDARKLDAVRQALRQRDFAGATKHGRVYELTPVDG